MTAMIEAEIASSCESIVNPYMYMMRRLSVPYFGGQNVSSMQVFGSGVNTMLHFS